LKGIDNSGGDHLVVVLEVTLRRAHMGLLKIRCPETGHELSTGIEVDPGSFARLPDKLAASKCPICGYEHAWLKCDARFIEDEMTGSAKEVR
jgi:hypothetical protein